MDALKFTLSGKTAFFKKHEVNTYAYFTYGNIHKVALLGLLGAILGYDGYAQQQKDKTVYPEFYEKLKDIKVAVVPECEDGFFLKKIQRYNNSVGYASFEKGGNLIVKEQWLENPSWSIFILLDCKEADSICTFLKEKKCIYMPYLGSRDHIADISEVKILPVSEQEEYSKIDSLVKNDNVVLRSIDDEDEDEEIEELYKYQEYLPVALDEKLNQYILEDFIKTNIKIESCKDSVYSVDGKNIVFY